MSDAIQDDPLDWLSEHGDALMSFAMVHLRQREVAEDLVQDTLLAAMMQRASFDGRSSRRTWLIGILRHKIVDHFRRRAVAERASDVLAEVVERAFKSSGKWQNSPQTWGLTDSDLERREVADALRTCLASLPPRIAEAFLLREHAQIEVEQLCQVLDTTPTNIWTMLYRARTALRECLERSLAGRKPAKP